MSSRVVLIVENDPDIGRLFSETAREIGLEAIVFSKGVEALPRLATVSPRLALIHEGLPDMSGRELIAQLRSDPRFADLPIILTSASKEPPDHRADAYLQKPFDLEDLLDLMEQMTR